MAIVNGKNVTVRIYDNGAYRLYACATSCSISVSTSTVETSVTGSGNWASFMPQKNSWSGTLDGMANFDTDANLSLNDLLVLQIAKTLLVVQFEYEDEGGNILDLNGSAYIVNTSSTGDVNNISTFSVELQGSGALVPVFTGTPDLLLINSTDNLLINSTDQILI